MKKLILLPVLAMFACVDGEKDTGEDTAGAADTTDTTDTTDTEDTEVPAPTANPSVTWGDSSVSLTLTVENGLDGASYVWGIAETSSDCGDNCWTGEDCFEGFELESGDVLNYCHPISATGGELFYGGEAASLGEGSETVFQNADLSEATTHIIDDRGSDEGPCWVWGQDVSYYSGYAKSCTEM